MGRIQEIHSGIGNVPYLSLIGSNPFLAPQAHFQEDNIEQISLLKKGQQISLVCDGDGVVIEMPMFKNCEFAQEYAFKKAEEIHRDIDNFLRGEKPDSKMTNKLVLISIITTKLLPPTSPCFTGKSGCKRL